MSRKAADFFASLHFLREGLDIEDDGPGRLAEDFLEALAGKDRGTLPEVFRRAVSLMHAEYDDAVSDGRTDLLESLQSAADGRYADIDQRNKALWRALFPEALYLDDSPDRQIELLRKKRLVDVEKLCSDPIRDPAREMIFTSNLLLSPPASETQRPADPELRRIVEKAEKVASEDQLFWYDHPVPIGVPADNDEAVYGLRGLSETLNFEKIRGNADAGDRMKVLLSVSVTHSGLRELALPWLKRQLSLAGRDATENLDVFAFTEDDASSAVDLLSPWLSENTNPEALKKTFGVDGEYGRHYSFLKALPALWSVFDSDTKATFKIDLDQVFPQEQLIAETGRSAFEHFCTSLWGAEVRDGEGRRLELGMLAGALVNEKDISKGLFTPDIPWPSSRPAGEDLLFFKQQPMAVSTRAELMTRYGYPGFPDGEKQALQRIHVTGGTNGIRFDALRKHRPFTPSFVGRAEDQAYILSVLDADSERMRLAYAHASGLIMRHDKEAFATEAVKAGKAGSYVGDLVRLFVFSSYAEMLPGGPRAVKSLVDPFTGCFISPMPATLAFLRLALHLLGAEGGSEQERQELLNLASRRLEPWTTDLPAMKNRLRVSLEEERQAWQEYFDALEKLESDIEAGSPEAAKASEKFSKLLEHCRVAG